MSVQNRVVRIGSVLLMGALLLSLSPAFSPAAAQSPQDTFTLHQWASSATATSQYGDPKWAALQAAGRPDTPVCGDQPTAWASATTTGEELLMLTYDTPVIPTALAIYQTNAPGAIGGIELELADGTGTVPVPDSADPGTACPGVLYLPISGITAPVNGVIIHLDQTRTGNWNEIDAVELVGEAEVGAPVTLWASHAMATSAYGVGSWDPLQATSAPDVEECGDNGSAWASASTSGQDVLTVFFDAPVIASQLDIHQSYTPGAIVSVDLIRSDYSSVPLPNSADPNTDCPRVFSLPITETSPIIGAAIHLDQTLTGNWNEIDAVQISGVLAAQTGEEIAQWASSATASSEYGTEGWSALQATGWPNTLVCADQPTAWASATTTGEEWLMLTYDTPVFPTAVAIYQTNAPGAITHIILGMSNGDGPAQVVPVSDDTTTDTTCPNILYIPVASGAEVNEITIQLDQSITGQWNEIDAVQLIGSPAP